MKVGDLIRNKSALGVHRGALGVIISTQPNLGDGVIHWCATGLTGSIALFLLEKVGDAHR